MSALALGLASIWPWLARVEAMVAMFCLPALAVAIALRKSLFQQRGLRALVWAVGGASVALAIVAAASTLFPGEPLGALALGPQARERSVALPPETSHLTLTVRAPAGTSDHPLRLGVGRGGQEREVAVSLEVSAELADSPFEMSEPVVERRVAVVVPGPGPLRVRLLEPADAAISRVELAVRATSLADRYAFMVGSALAAVGVVLQVLAERRRARSWLLFGSWFSIAFALWAPRAWDPSLPGWTALGALLFGAMAGGGAAALVSYLIARRCAPAGER
ncbi:MAG: hypothetical protein JRI23_06670 [Deltaproteobacteria bacterium]|nr:hypothetical protein [Deltaproteobacteria bacterium]MBW2531271.1 hypothetical protein [Deltaproteobacteria bacterium]